jgi:hypothetical protein
MNTGLLVYPELREVAPADRRAWLNQARHGELDAFELIGIACVFVLAVYLLTHIGLSPRAFGRTIALAANYLISLTLLVLLAGPLYVRRTRRHLRQLLFGAALAPPTRSAN